MAQHERTCGGRVAYVVWVLGGCGRPRGPALPRAVCISSGSQLAALSVCFLPCCAAASVTYWLTHKGAIPGRPAKQPDNAQLLFT